MYYKIMVPLFHNVLPSGSMRLAAGRHLASLVTFLEKLAWSHEHN